MQCHRRYCKASAFFQLSTQWRSKCSWSFSISNSCISDTDQWLYPQLFGLLVCHIVTVKCVVTGTRRLWGRIRNHGSGAIVPVGGSEKLFPNLPVSLWTISLPELSLVAQKGSAKAEAQGGCRHKWPSLPHRARSTQEGPNRHLIDARTFQQFKHWCLFLEKTVHFQLTWFSQQP